MISKPGNHVKFEHFVLLAVSEEAKTFFFVQCVIKQLLDSVFVISRIIKVEVRVVSQSLQLQLIIPTSTLIVLDISKTESNNKLLIVKTFFIKEVKDTFSFLQLVNTLNPTWQ